MSKNLIILVVVGIVIFSIVWYNKTHPTAAQQIATATQAS